MTLKEIRPGSSQEAEKIRWRPNVWNRGKSGRENKRPNQKIERIRELVESGEVALMVFEGRLAELEAGRVAGTVRAYMRRVYPEIPIETKVQEGVVENGAILAVRLRPDDLE